MTVPSGRRTAFISTLHDPLARLLPALRSRGAKLRWYAGVYVRVTDATDQAVIDELEARGVCAAVAANRQIGTARRLALEAAAGEGFDSYLYCDFDRWLHWVGRFPQELGELPERLLDRRPHLWYACLGRTARAFRTHPYVQRVAERATNHHFSVAMGKRMDATAGACWLSPEGAAIVAAHSNEESAATDLEWPSLIFREEPRRLGQLYLEGLEFETAEFHAAEIGAAGGERAWQRQTYERLDVWRARLELAVGSVRAATRVLGGPSPR